MSTSTQWQLDFQTAERYEQILVPAILGPAARALVEHAAVQRGETVLDVGCGTGAAARPAAVRTGAGGKVVAIDTNAGMIAVARRLPPLNGLVIDWRVENAYRLSLDDQTVDVALCAQTLQFLGNKTAALVEMRRVLKLGGRAALSLWCPLQDNPYFLALVESVEQHIGPGVAAGLRAAFSLAEAAEIRSLLEEAGFSRVEGSVRQLDLDMPPLAGFVPRHISATPMAPGFQAASPGAQQAVVREVVGRLSPEGAGREARLPFRTHLVLATKG